MEHPTLPAWRLNELAMQAINLAARSDPDPSPRVGAILVAPSGQILGRGWHRAAGLPHAEIEALRDAAAAGHDLSGAVLVVSLEPCNHHGSTPPCTDTILAAGIRHVHIALRDPIAAGGLERLRQAGVAVTLASVAIAAAAARQNVSFLRRVRNLP